MTVFTGSVRIADIKNALAEGDEYGFYDLADDTYLQIEGVLVDQLIVDAECSECGGEGPPDPEPVVDHSLIGDFIAALRAGDMLTARGLVYRVFEDTSDARAADIAICRCAQ